MRSAFNERLTGLAIAFAGVLFFYFKLNGASAGQTLWAEDGTVFIRDAVAGGVASLWKVYAGYIHLLPRFVALLALQLDTRAIPSLFLVAWFLSCLVFGYVMARRALSSGMSAFWVLALVLLVLAQPHSGEVFFNLTNLQWFTGGALSLYVLLPETRDASTLEKSGLVLAGLTGPFSVLLAPVLLCQLALLRDFGVRKSVYVIVLACAAIQVAFIAFNSERVTGGAIDRDINHWVQALLAFLLMGASSGVAKLVAAAFWMLTVFAAGVFVARRHDAANAKAQQVLFFLLAGTAIYFAAGLFSCKENPQILDPVGSGARYFYLPYAFLLLFAFLLTQGELLLRVLLAIVVVILDYVAYRPFVRGDLQFESFADLATVRPGVIIPLQPQWPGYPGWHVELPSAGAASADSADVQDIAVSASAGVQLSNIIEKAPAQPHQFTATGPDPQFVFQLPQGCDARTLGVELALDRAQADWIQVFWGADAGFSETRSLRRFYPAGNVVVHFAFPADQVAHIRIDPLETTGEFSIESLKLYCIGSR